jgi:hypothetical protein
LIILFTKRYLPIFSLFPGPNFTILIIPVQVTWSS